MRGACLGHLRSRSHPMTLRRCITDDMMKETTFYTDSTVWSSGEGDSPSSAVSRHTRKSPQPSYHLVLGEKHGEHHRVEGVVPDCERDRSR